MNVAKRMDQQMYSLDTHESVKILVRTGIKEEQAEKIVHLVHKSRNYDMANLVTKDQLESTKHELKADIAELRTEVAEVKAELKADIAEVRAEIAEVKAELKSDIAELRTELKADISDLRTEISNIKYDILKWIIPIMLSNTVAIIGIVVAIFLTK